MQIDHGAGQSRMAHQNLYYSDIVASFQQVSCVGVPQRMNSHTRFGDAGTLQLSAHSSLHCRDRHGHLSGRTALAVSAESREQPVGVAVQTPIASEHIERQRRQHHHAVLCALALPDMQKPSRSVDIAGLYVERLAETKTAGVDRAQIGVDVRRLDAVEQPRHFLPRQDGRLDNLALCTEGLQQLPVVLEQVVEEESQSAIQNALGTAVQLLVSLENEGAYVAFGQREWGSAEAMHKKAHLAGVGLARAPGQTGQHERIGHIAIPAVRVADIEVDVGKRVEYYVGAGRFVTYGGCLSYRDFGSPAATGTKGHYYPQNCIVTGNGAVSPATEQLA